MFERSQLALKIICGVVCALALYRLGLFLMHVNPLYHVTIPALPSLSSAAAGNTNAEPKSTGALPAAGANSVLQVSAPKGTNHTVQGTNFASTSSNLVARATNAVALGTNALIRRTNLVAVATNGVGHATNASARVTNSSPAGPLVTSGANSGPMPDVVRMGRHPGMPPGGFPGMAPGRFGGMPQPGPQLPPEIQSRIDRVIDSEILAPVMRPLPMALLGIAGGEVFLRAPNGQTGLIKQGEELGGVKLLSVGINRVLVEEQGEQKELTIFAGLGGESLLSTQKNSPK